ncbi:MAG: hypothetical protein M0R48_11240 [Candidatus Omnitrophica bacterium]|jgi:hypothetical protein|nr:hypothetical protein [Candidatus Omnitrophota bacterium]
MPTLKELLELTNAGNIGARMRLRENEEMFRHAEISQRMLDAQVIILDEGRYYILEQLTDGVWWPVATDELFCLQSIVSDVVDANRFLAETLYDYKPRRVLVVSECDKITVYECRFEEA